MTEELEHQDIVSQPVTTIMNAPVYTVDGQAVLLQALAAMVATGRRHLAVVDPLGRCHGVIGDRAIAAAWADNPLLMAHRTVQLLLDARPSVVGADATVGDVARQMHIDAVDAVVVIDRTGCPVGMVTGGDLIALMAKAIPAVTAREAAAPEVAPGEEPGADGTAS